MEKLSYKLPVFEGPLDLLLFLISKNKLNIYDIPVSELLEQYLSHIHEMQLTDMDVSSEFLEMAARLVYIKTAMLLPRHEEAEELKKELTGQLIEYQTCQWAAKKLGERYNADQFVRQPMEVKLDPRYRGRHERDELYSAYLMAVGRGKRKLPPPAAAFTQIVQRKIVSVTSRIFAILRRMARGQKVAVHTLYENSGSRSEIVATFLAVLELVRSHRVLLNEDNTEMTLSKEGRRRGH